MKKTTPCQSTLIERPPHRRIGTSRIVPLLLFWLLPLFGAPAAVVFTSLYSFTFGNDGGNPQAALVQGSDGFFYGTTAGGSGGGTVFRISTNGVLTTLWSFTFGNDGGNPQAALVQGSDSSFYGTTFQGGTNGGGTVFKISTNGLLTSLFSWNLYRVHGTMFVNVTPQGLVQGSDGSFYGTTFGGGTVDAFDASTGGGTVFRITTNGVLATLYSFTDGDDGRGPNGLVQGSDGSLYGTTQIGGTNHWGTVFKISTNWVLTTLYSFGTIQDWSGQPLDGGNPQAALVQGSDGSFYGTASYGGAGTNQYGQGCGTVFRITTNGVLATLYSFTGGTDGANPQAALVQGSDGYFYGTTEQSDYSVADQEYLGYGTVFTISTNGTLTTLHSFTGGDGGSGPNGLVQGSDGNFYGTTSAGGTNGGGTVFRLTIVPDPQLTLIPSGPYMILTWPTNYGVFSYAGYTLQSATNLGSSAVWTPVSPGAVTIGNQNIAISTISGARQFYRLSQ